MLSQQKSKLYAKLNAECEFVDLAIIAQNLGCDLDTGMRTIVLDILFAEPTKDIRKAYNELW